MATHHAHIAKNYMSNLFRLGRNSTFLFSIDIGPWAKSCPNFIYLAVRSLTSMLIENLGESGFIEWAKIVLCRAKHETETGFVKKDCNVSNKQTHSLHVVLY